MGKVTTILFCAFLILFASIVWQVAACELANYELQDELKDTATLNSWRIGLTPPRSDDDLRQSIIDKARTHKIKLSPSQIVVERSGTDESPVVFLAVDYKARIILPGFAVTIRFRPTSRGPR